MLDRVDGDILHQRRLRRIHHRDVDDGDATVTRQRHHWQDSVRMAQAAIQAQLAQEERVACLTFHPHSAGEWRLLRRHQNGDCDGQIVGGASLAQIGGGEVDDDAAQGKDRATVLDGGAHPLLRLSDGGVGQAHDAKGGQSMPNIDLDLDQRAIQPDDRATARLRQHRRLTLRGSGLRVQGPLFAGCHYPCYGTNWQQYRAMPPS